MTFIPFDFTCPCTRQSRNVKAIIVVKILRHKQQKEEIKKATTYLPGGKKSTILKKYHWTKTHPVSY